MVHQSRDSQVPLRIRDQWVGPTCLPPGQLHGAEGDSLESVSNYSSYFNKKGFNSEREVLMGSSAGLKEGHVTPEHGRPVLQRGLLPCFRNQEAAAGTIDISRTQPGSRLWASLSRRSAVASHVGVPKTTPRLGASL